MVNNKSKISTLLSELFSLAKNLKFADISLADGTCIRTPDDTLIKGSKVQLVSPDGTVTDVTDGDHTAADGSIITIKSGVVDNLTPAPAPATTTAPAAPATTSASAYPAATTAPATMASGPAAPAATDDTNTQVSSMDMQNLIELIKNLVDRVSALEGAGAATSMAVEKLSAAPAANPIGSNVYGENTIGAVLNKYKSEHKSNRERIEKQMLEFSSKRTKPGAMSFSNSAGPSSVKASVKENPASFNLFGSALQSFSITQ